MIVCLSVDETTMVTIFSTACVIVVVALMMRVMFNAEQQHVAATRSKSNNRSQQTSSQPANTRYRLPLLAFSSFFCRVVPNVNLFEFSCIRY
jgi:hypothetical protein